MRISGCRVKEKTQDRLAEFFVGGGDGSERGGRKPGLTTDIAAKLKTLERENRELRQANEILRKLALILPRRSSTADTSHDRVHRRSPQDVWGRADLQGAVDRPIHLPCPCRKAGQSRQAVGAREAGCDPQD
jgi:transposase